jgi:molecular chaperone DnaK
LARSAAETVVVDLPGLDPGGRPPFDAQVALSRADVEECAAEVRRRACSIARRAVEEVAGLRWDQIDEVILVGGQTLMPALQRDVEQLSGRRPRVNDRPQQAVALGAGVYGRILSLGRARFHENALVNVLALALGIRLDDNAFEPLAPANATVPFLSAPFAVTTTEDNQTSIHVELLQGPRGATRADQCVVLGSIDMEVPPAPARQPRFEVQLDVRSDGTLKVKVSDSRRDRQETLEVVGGTVLAWRDRPETPR